MKWYVINTQVSCENIAKIAIEKLVAFNNVNDQFGEILIPTENVVELVKGQKRYRTKKFFPGYIFVQMKLTDVNAELVKSASKVGGFIGGGVSKPVEVSQEEVMNLTKQMKEGVSTSKPRLRFSLGDNVLVTDGPFNSFSGVVEEINEEKSKVKVLVTIFGRPTPVELDFLQVEPA